MNRFFSSRSFWNTPISENPEIDPESEDYAALLAKDAGGPFWGINLFQWTIPVYEVNAQTPRHKVLQRAVTAKDDPLAYYGKLGTRFRHYPGFGESVPIPDGALSDPEGDSHLAMIDAEQNLAWDMWGARRRADGQWESCTGMCYELSGSGVFDPGDFSLQDGDSIHFHGPSRASGVPAIAGLIMHHEIEAGKIEHKLACATRSNAKKKFVFPAIWTDGPLEFGIPEGAVLQLDPALDLDSFKLSRGGRIVAEALQKYGAVNTDNAGGNALYGEWIPRGNPGRAWEGLLDPFCLKEIHVKHFRVLKLRYIQRRGFDGHPGPNFD